jgi:hypothetical protein
MDKELISRICKELKTKTKQQKTNSFQFIYCHSLRANELNRQFSEMQMANKHMKKQSTSFAMKEMQIKTHGSHNGNHQKNKQ